MGISEGCAVWRSVPDCLCQPAELVRGGSQVAFRDNVVAVEHAALTIARRVMLDEIQSLRVERARLAARLDLARLEADAGRGGARRRDRRQRVGRAAPARRRRTLTSGAREDDSCAAHDSRGPSEPGTSAWTSAGLESPEQRRVASLGSGGRRSSASWLRSWSWRFRFRRVVAVR
jgi:hypothetical protein